MLKKISVVSVLFTFFFICQMLNKTFILSKPLDISVLPEASSQTEDSYDRSQYDSNLDEKTIQNVRKCEADQRLMELCQRCVRVTKYDVYPSCCGNEGKVRQWCHDYVFFGKVLPIDLELDSLEKQNTWI
uniref:Uncharacterized protein n=1 Tax=Glossina brevipalpis TaxID=37001 RepID=A0A1A9WNA3_9MUSC